jgi:hypothetical protein
LNVEVGYQIPLDSRGATLRQNLIEGVAAHSIGVTCDQNRGTLQPGIAESGTKLAQLRFRIRSEGGGVES